MNKYWIILSVALVLIVISIPFIFVKKTECGYWDEIGIRKECGCTGKMTTSGDIGGKFYCSGECLQDCVCQAPHKTNGSSSYWERIKTFDCKELDMLISEGYYGEGAKYYIN